MNINNFQIELVQGCTRRCDFCGINQISANPSKFMDLDLAKHIALQIDEQFKSKIRIEFAVHGEPLLHPQVVEIIQMYRQIIPQSQLSIISNGDVLIKNQDLARQLFQVGLNYLMIDFYDDHPVRTKKIMHALDVSDIQIYDFYKDDINIWSYRNPTVQGICLVPALQEHSGEKSTRIIHTAGGNLPRNVWQKYDIDKSQFPKLTRCAKPFREMSINYDGNVSLCCEDWQRTQTIDNVQDTKIVDIWNGETFNKYRYLLYYKRRDLIDLCSLCNERSFRVGLLKIEKEYPELIKDKTIKGFFK